MYKSLQSTRAIAAIIVVLYHLGGTISSSEYFGVKALSIPFSWGYAGVPFFFVLSGFIILYAHKNDIFKSEKLFNYLIKRFARIYPTYWIVFFCIFTLAVISSLIKHTNPQVPIDPIVLLKALFLIPQDPKIIGGTGAPVIPVAWTLQYEMFFYLFFAGLIFSRKLIIFLVCGLVGVYAVKVMGFARPPSFLFSFIASDYIFLFLMGMIVSIAHTSNKIKLEKPEWVAGAGVILFLVLALSDVLAIGLANKTIFYGLASSLIIFGLIRAEDQGQIFLNNSLFQALGTSSYVLYLIHYQLINTACKLSKLIHLDELGLFGAMIAYVSIFITCLIIAVVFNQIIERPISDYFRRHIKKRESY